MMYVDRWKMYDFNKKRLAASHIDAAIALIILAVSVLVFLIRFADISRKSQITSLLRKNYNVLNKVIAYSEAENGTNLYWELPKSNEFEDMEVFLSKYYLPFFKDAILLERKSMESMYSILKNENGETSDMITNYILLNDKSILSFYFNEEDRYMLLFADINGTAQPNVTGRDIFVYLIFNGKYHRVSFLEDNHNIGDMKYLMADDNFGCNKKNTSIYRNFYCGRVIELNDWELPKDYPL